MSDMNTRCYATVFFLLVLHQYNNNIIGKHVDLFSETRTKKKIIYCTTSIRACPQWKRMERVFNIYYCNAVVV